MEEQVQNTPRQEQEIGFSLFEGQELRQLKNDNLQLQQRLHDLGHQTQTKFQSLGSVRSAGSTPQKDSFLMGFDQD